MPVLALVIVGAAAGFLAARIMRLEAGVVATVAVGVLGALLAGMVLRVVIAVTGWAIGFVGAVLGAMLLIWLWRSFGSR